MLRLKLTPMIFLGILFLSFIFFSYNNSTVTASNSLGEKSTMVLINDSGRTVEVFQDDSLTIKLESNPSTGYRWHFEEIDQNCLELIDKSTESLAEGKKIDGAPINRYWVFKARKPGTSSIRMSYYRKWEGPGHSKKTFDLTVIIKP